MKNYGGYKAWIYARGSNFERFLFTLHRITGIILIFYLLIHIIIVSSRAFGQSAFEKVMGFVGISFENGVPHTNHFVHFLEFLLVAAIAFHAFNGIRLLINELGFLIGKPRRPDYPYVPYSITKTRPLMIFLMIIAFIFLIFGVYEFFFLTH